MLTYANKHSVLASLTSDAPPSSISALRIESVLQGFQGSDLKLFTYELPQLSEDDQKGRDLLISKGIFPFHSQENGRSILRGLPRTFEDFEDMLEVRLKNANLSIAEYISISGIVAKIVRDVEQANRLCSQCMHLLLSTSGEESPLIPIRTHVAAGFGGMSLHVDGTLVTFSVQYGPGTTEYKDEDGKILSLPSPSFSCWSGTQLSRFMPRKSEFRDQALRHRGSSKTRLSFILPLNPRDEWTDFILGY